MKYFFAQIIVQVPVSPVPWIIFSDTRTLPSGAHFEQRPRPARRRGNHISSALQGDFKSLILMLMLRKMLMLMTMVMLMTQVDKLPTHLYQNLMWTRQNAAGIIVNIRSFG